MCILQYTHVSHALHYIPYIIYTRAHIYYTLYVKSHTTLRIILYTIYLYSYTYNHTIHMYMYTGGGLCYMSIIISPGSLTLKTGTGNLYEFILYTIDNAKTYIMLLL